MSEKRRCHKETTSKNNGNADGKHFGGLVVSQGLQSVVLLCIECPLEEPSIRSHTLFNKRYCLDKHTFVSIPRIGDLH